MQLNGSEHARLYLHDMVSMAALKTIVRVGEDSARLALSRSMPHWLSQARMRPRVDTVETSIRIAHEIRL